MNTNKSIKINDVAKAVGVSPSTVSYVLSGKRPVSDEVKQKVLEKIEVLGYKPNAVARNLASKKTNTIGLYCSKYSDENDIFFLRMINGIMDSVAASGYKLLLINEIEGNDNFSIPIDRSFPIDGAIITNARNSQIYLSALQREKLPFVLIGKPPKDVDVSYVDNDNVKSCYKAIEYLFKKNMRKVGLVISTLDNATVNLDSIAGYILAHSDYQQNYDPNLIFRVNDRDNESVDELFELFDKYQIEGLVVTSLFMPVISRLFRTRSGSKKIKPVIFGYDILSKYNFGMDEEIAYIESNAYKLGCEAATRVVKYLENRDTEISHTLFDADLKVWKKV